MTSHSAVDSVVAWHAALNRGDIEQVLALSAADVEVGGPRGTSRGTDVLRDWVSRAGLTLVPGRIFARADASSDVSARVVWTVVVEEAARWPGADGRPGEPQIVATAFRVVEGQIVSIIRYADLATALSAMELAESDEQPSSTPRSLT